VCTVFVLSFQFDIFDEYVFNAVSFISHLIYTQSPVGPSDNAATLITNHSDTLFDSLHGSASIDSRHNVLMYFSLWDLDPSDGLFYPVLEQGNSSNDRLVVVRDRVIHWPGNGEAPAPDYCAFTDCSTSRQLSSTLLIILCLVA